MIARQGAGTGTGGGEVAAPTPPIVTAVRRAAAVAAVAVVALAAVIALASAATDADAATADAEADAGADDLDRARERLEAVEEQLDSGEAGEDDHAAAVADAQVLASELADAAERAERAVVRQAERVRHAEQERDALAEEAEERRAALSERADALYRLRVAGSGSLGALLEAASPDEALRRSGLLEVMSRSEVADLEQLGADQQALIDLEEALAAEEAALARLSEEREELLAQARDLRDDAAEDLPGFTDELEDLQAEETHLDSEQRELAELAAEAADEAAAQVVAAEEEAAEEEAAEQASQAAAEPQYRWPAQGPVTSEFGPRWGRMHEGLDIGGSTGQTVMAARSGQVASTGRQGGYGNLVLIDHGDGITTAYAHLNSIEVSPGQSVEAGQRIGGMGCTGRCTGTHLHFEVRSGGQAQNPRGYLP